MKYTLEDLKYYLMLYSRKYKSNPDEPKYIKGVEKYKKLIREYNTYKDDTEIIEKVIE